LFRRAQSTKHTPITTMGANESKSELMPPRPEYVTELHTFDPAQNPIFPSFRMMNEQGQLLNTKRELALTNDDILDMYKKMVEIHAIDIIFMQAQRHGRVSFHMQNAGEEGLQIGSAAALKPQDHIFSQYRELGVFLHRGFDVRQMAHQCFSTEQDFGKGRQMPIHFGSKALNMHTISSPLATQLPQAAGLAYAMKRRKEDAVTVCYFGDGAASEGDFHAALNFAATLECPVIFFCRNNGWAISTPSYEQFRGDGILSRVSGYGMCGIRVDGNDMFAVYEATKAAREYCAAKNQPILVEAMSYRRGHHSSSDDSTTYRPKSELEWWQENDDPLTRVRLYLEGQKRWDSDKELELRKTMKKKVIEALSTAEKAKKPPIEELFTDVYAELPKRLQRQQEELRAHLNKYADEYNLDQYADSE